MAQIPFLFLLTLLAFSVDHLIAVIRDGNGLYINRPHSPTASQQSRQEPTVTEYMMADLSAVMKTQWLFPGIDNTVAKRLLVSPTGSKLGEKEGCRVRSQEVAAREDRPRYLCRAIRYNIYEPC